MNAVRLITEHCSGFSERSSVFGDVAVGFCSASSASRSASLLFVSAFCCVAVFVLLAVCRLFGQFLVWSCLLYFLRFVHLFDFCGLLSFLVL